MQGVTVDAGAYLQLWEERCRNHPTRKNVGLSPVWAFFQEVSDDEDNEGTKTRVRCVVCDKIYSYKPSTGQHHITNHMLRSCPLHEKLYRSVEASIGKWKNSTVGRKQAGNEMLFGREIKELTGGQEIALPAGVDSPQDNGKNIQERDDSQAPRRSGDLTIYLDNWKEWSKKKKDTDLDASWGIVAETVEHGSIHYECLSCRKSIGCKEEDVEEILQHAREHPLLYRHLQVEVALLHRKSKDQGQHRKKKAKMSSLQPIEVNEVVLASFLSVWESSCKQHPTRKNTGLAPVWAFYKKIEQEHEANSVEGGKSIVQCLICGKTYSYSPSTGQSHMKGHLQNADGLHATLYSKVEEKLRDKIPDCANKPVVCALESKGSILKLT